MGRIFRPVEPEDYDQVRQLLISTGWQQRVQDPDRFKRMIRGANRTVVAIEDERVVGFARALFDGASNGYISTVAVAADSANIASIALRMVHLLCRSRKAAPLFPGNTAVPAVFR